MTAMNKCLPPCYQLSSQLKKTTYRTNRPSDAFLKITSEQKVRVITDAYSFSIFSLVVELGSALGLWLGLSALNIVELVFRFSGQCKIFVQENMVTTLNVKEK